MFQPKCIYKSCSFVCRPADSRRLYCAKRIRIFFIQHSHTIILYTANCLRGDQCVHDCIPHQLCRWVGVQFECHQPTDRHLSIRIKGINTYTAKRNKTTKQSAAWVAPLTGVDGEIKLKKIRRMFRIIENARKKNGTKHQRRVGLTPVASRTCWLRSMIVLQAIDMNWLHLCVWLNEIK